MLALQGREAVQEQLLSVVKVYATFGRVQFQVVHVDCQPLGSDGSVLLQVRSHFRPVTATRTKSVFRLQVEGTISAAQLALHQCTSFCECFVLRQTVQGEYYVAHQMFRMMT